MHQSTADEVMASEEHLDREWQMFLAIEAGSVDQQCLTWETARPLVVVGHSASVADQVVVEACRGDGVPIVRRFSGGGAVVLGPGCLNYAVGLSLVSRPELKDVAHSFHVILGGLAAALGVDGLSIDGGTDLVLNGRKVSGNAQRRGRRALIHHGTLLYDFDSRLAARYLKEPCRQPGYRYARTHVDFMGNLPLPRETVRARLMSRWTSSTS
jgi:lipoate-protein ligase A